MSDAYVRDGQTVRRRLICLRSAHLQHLSSTGGYLILVPLACWYWLVAVVLTYPLQTFRKSDIPDTSRGFPCTAWLLFPITTTAQQVNANKTSTLGSIISYHDYFLFNAECVSPSPDTQSHWKQCTYTHARKLLYKHLAGMFELFYKKNTKKLLQLQTACLSFSHSAPHICMKTIHR